MAVENPVQGIAFQTYQSLYLALSEIVNATMRFLPNLVAAIIIVVIGWVIGVVLKKIVMTVLQSLKIDQWMEEQNLSPALGGQEVSGLVGSFVKWYVIAVFLAQAASTFQLFVLGDFLLSLAGFIPVLLVALVIFAIGILIARYVRNAVEATTHSHRKTIALIVEISIIYLAIVVALRSIGIEVQILEDVFKIAFMAFALTIAIIAGISFGFAFKEDAKRVLKEFQK